MLNERFGKKRQPPPAPRPAANPQPTQPTNPKQFIEEPAKTDQGRITHQAILAHHLSRIAENRMLESAGDTIVTDGEMYETDGLLNPNPYARGDAANESNIQQLGQTLAHPESAPIPASGLEGTVINENYLIESLIAQGGMGQVFLCTHLKRNNIPVVLKLMPPSADRQSPAFSRFIQECIVTGRLRHPNLIRVLDYGLLIDGLKPFLVMEFVEGHSMRQILRQEKRLHPIDAASILSQACQGLIEVHSKGIIHRDLKPENLMVRGDYTAHDNVKILDFGIAQLQSENRVGEEGGWAIGSIGYMSPEQICASPVDPRTDIYSLGLIFYEAVTGRPPFKGATKKETLAMHVKIPHVPPSQVVQLDCGQWIDKIIDNCLAKDPNDRYPSALDLQNDLVELIPPEARFNYQQ